MKNLLFKKMNKYEDLINVSKNIYDENPIGNLCNASALLKQYLCEVNWVGFYVVKNNKLVLGPFQGKASLTKIPLDKGVYGQAASLLKTVVINNVTECHDYISYNHETKSKIILPLLKEKKLFALLDIDSPIFARFEENDVKYLEIFVKTLEEYI